MVAKSRVQRLLILWAAVTGLILMNACTRGGGGQNIEQKTPPIATPAPGPTTSPELDKDSSKSSTDPKSPDEKSKDVAPDAPVSNGSNDEIKIDDNTASGDPDSAILDPTGLTPTQIFGQSSVDSTTTDLHYSGAGQDGLRRQIQKYVDAKAETARAKRDKAFAKSIVNAEFHVDWSTREAQISVLLNRKSGQHFVRFNGSLDNKLLFRSGDLHGGSRLALEAACMDLRGGCDTVYVKLTDASTGQARTAHLLLRTTKSTLFTKADGFNLSRNEEFNNLLAVLVNTVKNSGRVGALNSLTLRTTEVINGRSSFKVEMSIRTGYRYQDDLNFGGALLKKPGTSSLLAPARVLPSSSPMGQTIRNVALIQNDGRGDLTLAVTIRKAAPEANEDTMNITFARIHKPVRPLILAD